MTRQHISSGTEHGSALIIALILLVLLTIIGVSAIQNTTMQERMAGNMKEQHRAFQAAEQGLREAEGTIGFGSPCPALLSDFTDFSNMPNFTALTTSGDELAAEYSSDFCGPVIRGFADDVTGLTPCSDAGAQSCITVYYYNVRSIGRVPDNAEVRLLSTFGDL